MNLASKFLEKSDFTSYGDFCDNFKFNIPDNFNFSYDVVDEYARLEPDRLALIWCDDEGSERFFSFGELKKYSDKAANFFKAQGLKKGDKVMVILRRRYEYYFVVLGLSKLGVIYIPSTDQLTEQDLIYRNNAGEIKMIVAYNRQDIIAHVEKSLEESPTVEQTVLVGGEREGWVDFDTALETASDHWTRPEGDANTYNDDIMLIYFTSGTTAMPKMTVHDFTYPLGHIVNAKYWQRVLDGGRHLTVADSGWAKFGWGKIFGQWICGVVMFLYDMERFDPCKLLEKIQRYQLQTFCAPPTLYRFLLQEDLDQYDLSSLVHCSTAGEPLNPDVFKRFMEKSGLPILNGFGQTETSVLVANFEWFDVIPGAMGKPNPAYAIDVVDDDGHSVADGVEGELVVRNVDNYKPPGLCCGYYKDSEATSKLWYNNTYHTGDVVYRDEHGYLWFVGRKDDVIKASGYRISPFEVESKVIEHPAVVECAVTGAPDKLRGTVVKATIVLARGYVPSEELKKEIQVYVKTVTAPYKYPRIIEFVEELPKTIGGKIKRANIRREDELQDSFSKRV